MAKHPYNLLLRFVLELVALYCMGYWGWTGHEGAPRYLLAFGLPFLAAVVWGTFRVPGDGGAPRVQVSGVTRLVIEAIFFSFATWGLFDSGATTAGWVFGGLTLFHYIISYDRINWILKQ
jgi:hypothetical protein